MVCTRVTSAGVGPSCLLEEALRRVVVGGPVARRFGRGGGVAGPADSVLPADLAVRVGELWTLM